MALPVVAVWSEDPLLADVVAHVLQGRGYPVVRDEPAEVEVSASAERIRVRARGADLVLVRPFWEAALLDALDAVRAGPAPVGVRPVGRGLAAK